MAWRLIVAKDGTLSEDVNQIVRCLNGVATYGQRVQLTQLNDPTNYALDVRNLDPGNSYIARFRDASDNVILAVNKAGIALSGGVTAYDVGIGEVQVTPLGIFGEDVSEVDTFTLLNAASTRNGEALGLGDVLLGLNTGTEHNVLWDRSTGEMCFREGTTPKVKIDVHGLVTLVGNLGITGDIVLPVGEKLDINGTKPIAVGTTPGVDAAIVLNVVAPQGGDTTINSTGVGGVGGFINLTAGGGGLASAAGTSSTGGAGGDIALTGGAGGLADETGSDYGGQGGAVGLLGGGGGNVSVGGGTKLGGVGGEVVLLGGAAGYGGGDQAGGPVAIDSGAPYGTTGASAITIGATNAKTIGLGNAVTVVTVPGYLGITGQVLQPIGYPLVITKTKPADVGTTPGTAAGNVLTLTGAAGGNTTINSTGTGGTGSGLVLQAGAGGLAAAANTLSRGGAGGVAQILGGAGGVGSGSGTSLGGDGGAVDIIAGAGGDATAGGTRTGGPGGSLHLLAGDAGHGSGTNANGGTVTLDSGSPDGSGTSAILIGTSKATAIVIGTSLTTVMVAGPFGCNNHTPQPSYASGGALASYASGVYGLDSAAHMAALHELVVRIRAALVAMGIMS